MTITKTALRFFLGYAIGWLIVFCVMFFPDCSLIRIPNILWILVLWLPIALVYGILIITALKYINIARLTWSFEICGLCVGVFPLVSGMWPTYWFIFPAAIYLIGIQCSILTFAMLILYLMHRIMKRNSSPVQPSTSGNK
jgi:hypothetical protein